MSMAASDEEKWLSFRRPGEGESPVAIITEEHCALAGDREARDIGLPNYAPPLAK